MFEKGSMLTITIAYYPCLVSLPITIAYYHCLLSLPITPPPVAVPTASVFRSHPRLKHKLCWEPLSHMDRLFVPFSGTGWRLASTVDVINDEDESMARAEAAAPTVADAPPMTATSLGDMTDALVDSILTRDNFDDASAEEIKECAEAWCPFCASWSVQLHEHRFTPALAQSCDAFIAELTTFLSGNAETEGRGVVLWMTDKITKDWITRMHHRWMSLQDDVALFREEIATKPIEVEDSPACNKTKRMRMTTNGPP